MYKTVRRERPGVLQISRALHQARDGQCQYPPEHCDVGLAVAIIADREGVHRAHRRFQEKP